METESEICLRERNDEEILLRHSIGHLLSHPLMKKINNVAENDLWFNGENLLYIGIFYFIFCFSLRSFSFTSYRL